MEPPAAKMDQQAGLLSQPSKAAAALTSPLLGKVVEKVCYWFPSRLCEPAIKRLGNGAVDGLC